MEKSQNPKDLLAKGRVPMWALPSIGAIHGAMAINDGLKKGYGPYNWRDKPIEMVEYIGALERHIACIKDGEDIAIDSLVSHLGHIIATATIILDAEQCGTLIDNRPKISGHAAETLEDFKMGIMPGEQK